MPDPDRNPGQGRLQLPRSWVVRVVLAWLAGLVVFVLLNVIRGGSHGEAAFWTLAAVLAAFALADGVRSRR